MKNARATPATMRLKELIRRKDRVLSILHPPTATLACILERAGCEAGFVGTGGVVGDYTGLADVGTATLTECVPDRALDVLDNAMRFYTRCRSKSC